MKKNLKKTNKKKNNILKIGKPKRDARIKNLINEVTGVKKFIKFSLNIPPELHKDFQIATAIDGKDMKDVLIDAILVYVNKYKIRI